MNKLETTQKIVTVQKLTRQERTGTPDQLAKRLSVSRATLYRMIDELKSYGSEIKFCRTRNSFYYSGDKVTDIHFRIDSFAEMTEEELRNISGGTKIFSLFLFPSQI